MYAPRKSAGYSLVELMVVVALVGIAMSLAGPSLYAAMTESRAVNAAHDILSLGRRAYWESVRYRRAHVLSFTGMTGPGSPGRVELIRGDTNLCSVPANTWSTSRGIADCGQPDSRCIDWVAMVDYQGWGDLGPVLTSPSGATLAICYRPNGTVAVSTAGLTSNFAANVAAASDAKGNNWAGGLIFNIQTHDGTSYAGVQRRLFFPLGGVPRRLR